MLPTNKQKFKKLFIEMKSNACTCTHIIASVWEFERENGKRSNVLESWKSLI